MSENEKNDLLADLLDEEQAIENGEAEPKANTDDIEALKNQVEELSSANAGLLKAKQSATRKRQQFEDKVNQMEGAINAILSQRQQQGMESVSESEAAGARAQGIPVTYDDDGNGWIDPNYIQQLTTPYEQRINELEMKLQQTNASTSAQSNAQRIMESIVGEDERFGPASGRYRAARKWVEDQVFDFTEQNGINKVMSSGEALDHVFSDPNVQKLFNAKFGGMDLVDVVTAEDSQAHFRRTLNNIANAMTPKDEDAGLKPKAMDSRFQKVLDKPSTLGSQANAKAGQLSVLEKVGNLKTEDIMSLSEEQINTLMKLAGEEGI